MNARKRCARRGGSIAVALLALLSSTPATAHVYPSPDANNRFLKLSPMADRLRIAYTVFYGQAPGRALRAELDESGDGTLSEAEYEPLGARLAEQVARTLTITIDGVRAPLAWEQVHVGLGMPVTDAGAFSVDLIAWLCVPGGVGEHEVRLVDGFDVPRAGDNELQVEAAPGIEVVRSAFGDGAQGSQLKLKWRGALGPIASVGYGLAYRVDDAARAPDDTRCPADLTPGRPKHFRAWILAGLGLLGLVAGGIWWRRRPR